MVLSEVSFEVDIVLFNFGWKSFVSLKSSFLSVTFLVASVVLNDAIKLLLEHADSFDWVLSNIPGQIGTDLPQVV